LKTTVLRGLSVSAVMAALMLWTLPLAILQVLCVILFGVWVFTF
jgi:hypothetical protein